MDMSQFPIASEIIMICVATLSIVGTLFIIAFLLSYFYIALTSANKAAIKFEKEKLEFEEYFNKRQKDDSMWKNIDN